MHIENATENTFFEEKKRKTFLKAIIITIKSQLVLQVSTTTRLHQ